MRRRRRLLLPLPIGERAGVRGRGLLGRTPLLLTTAFVVAAMFAANASAADLVRVGNAGAVAFSFMPTNVGKDAGIFAKHDLDINDHRLRRRRQIAAGHGGDAVDVGLGSGPGMAFIVKGSPVKAIADIAGPPLIFALVVRTDGSVKTIDDLKGRKVGISTVGSATSWLMNEVSRQHGWGFDGFDQVAIGDNAARLAALKTGAIDGCVVDVGSALNFVEHGDGRILMRFGDVAKNFIMHVIFATDTAMAQEARTICTDFLQGWFETIAYMRAHKAKTVAIAMTVMGTDAKTTSGIYDELMPMFTDNGHFDPKALAVLQRSFVEMKTLPDEPDMSKLYTEAFLPKN